MAETAQLPVRFEPREPPLEPRAALFRASAVPALLRRCARAEDSVLARWHGVVFGSGAQSGVVLVGDALPWVDGVAYLGRDPEALSLLLPTHSTPHVGAALLERALVRQLGAELRTPLVVAPTTHGLLVVPVDEARPLSRRALAQLGATP